MYLWNFSKYPLITLRAASRETLLGPPGHVLTLMRGVLTPGGDRFVITAGLLMVLSEH